MVGGELAARHSLWAEFHMLLSLNQQIADGI